MLLQKCEISFGKVGTHGLCVRETHTDYQLVIGCTDRASLHPNMEKYSNKI